MTATNGFTAELVQFVTTLDGDRLPEQARHHARRHLLDTVGVMIAGARGEVTRRAEAMLGAIRPAGPVPVPGRARRGDLLDAIFLGGTAAHGLELDDGFTQGLVHPGCAVVPAALALGAIDHATGPRLLEAVVAGYETVAAIGRACHPALRQRGFHPTSVVAVFGAAVTAARLRGASPHQLAHALGLAASSAAGVFAFVNGGADVKRLHAGHGAREGVQATLLAMQGIEGPPNIFEARDGFLQAFAFGREGARRDLELPPAVPYGITRCYVKPYPCCRHLQPAVEATIALLEDHQLAVDDVARVVVETYRIAAEHADTGWEDLTSAQLSFPYVIALALRYRKIALEHFDAAVRNDPAQADVARRVEVVMAPALDATYPALRPARVTLSTARGSFTKQVDDALGSHLLPLDDAALGAKFHQLVAPVIGDARATELADGLWRVDALDDVAPLIELMMPR